MMPCLQHTGWHNMMLCLQATEGSAFEAWRAAETARLERDRRVLDKQSKAILKVGSKVPPVLEAQQSVVG